MGWANCGEDSKGRPIGYAHEAVCDFPGCNVEIDRGLSYACGGMHGDRDGFQCEGYFCSTHLSGWATNADGELKAVCKQCEVEYEKTRQEYPEDFENVEP